ncbi:hypothetical protein RV01_GL002402 [Enterococcus dispar]|nr:hypothetical protein RV01_GL002402 [Enterococcus dispar]
MNGVAASEKIKKQPKSVRMKRNRLLTKSKIRRQTSHKT